MTMKLTGIKECDYIEITPIEIERVTPDSPINAINCSISVVSRGFSGTGEFWAGGNWHEFIQNLENLNRTLSGNANLEWKVGDDKRMSLTVFNLDSKGHLFVRIKIVSDEYYTDRNQTMSAIETGFEIDPNALTGLVSGLEEIWSR
jgi:hypothetical protein